MRLLTASLACLAIGLSAGLSPALAQGEKELDFLRLKVGDVGRAGNFEFRVTRRYDSDDFLLASPWKRGLAHIDVFVDYPAAALAENSLIKLPGLWKVSGPIECPRTGRKHFRLMPVKGPAGKPARRNPWAPRG